MRNSKLSNGAQKRRHHHSHALRDSRELRSVQSTQYKAAALAVAACFSASVLNPAHAGPTNPVVVNGAAQFTTVGNLLSITNTPNAIINWGSFSIGANEITRFIQQSASSAVLNRVVGQNPSSILGALQSNGRVFLINPNGIVFGAGSQINVGGLVASTLNLSNEDFLAGRMRFTGGSLANTGKSVINQGDITTSSGGNVYLIGNAVTNNGIITSPKGEVILAAGTSVELVNPGTPDLRVEIVAPDNQAINLGSIVAESGRIGIYAGLINQANTLNANSVVVGENGRITLKATKNIDLGKDSITTANGPNGGKIEIQSGDTTLVSGVVEAKGQQLSLPFGGEAEATGKGGEIKLLGNLVGLDGKAAIDASGENGGGTVLVGGDFQGKNANVQNAFRTFVGSDVNIKADAITSGNGGKVIVWSDDYTVFGGTLSAQGGALSGNGGFAEVSGHASLTFSPKAVRLDAFNGDLGTLLLDPLNIIVATGGGAAIGNVSTFAANAGTTQTIDPLTLNAVAATVNLQATNDITVNSAINLTTAAAGLVAKAGNNITINAGVTTNNGVITLSARDPGTTPTVGGIVNILAPLNSTGGAITITNNNGTSAGTVGANINAGTGSVAINTANTTNVSASVSGGAITAGTVNFVAASTETVTGTSFTASAINAVAGSNVTLSAPTTVGSFAVNSATLTLNSNLNATNTSSLSGTGSILGAGNLDINSGGLAAQFNWNGGTLGGTGTLTTSTNITPSLGGGAVTLGRNWTMNSASAIMSGGPLTINAGSTWFIPVGSSFTLNSGAAAPQIAGGGTLQNKGTINVTVASTIGDGTTLFDNLGAVSTIAAPITINASNSGGTKDTGSYNMNNTGAAQLTFAGGTRTIASTGSLNNGGLNASVVFSGGNFTMDAGAAYSINFLGTTINGATVTFDNVIFFNNLLNLSSGILQGAGNLVGNAGLAWSGGTLQGSGQLVTGGGVASTVNPAGTVTLGRPLNANRGINLTSGNININNDGVTSFGALTLGDTGTGNSLFSTTSSSPVTGTGILKVNSLHSLGIIGPALSDYTVTNFSNKGTVIVNSGTVRLVGTGTDADTGDYVNNGVNLVFGAGTRSIAGNISGSGGVTFNGAVMTLTGAYTPAGTTTVSTALNPASSVTFNQVGGVNITNLQMQGGVIDGTANLTVPTLNWTGGSINTTGAGTLSTSTSATVGGAVNLGRNWTMNSNSTIAAGGVVTIADNKTLTIGVSQTLTLAANAAATTPFVGSGSATTGVVQVSGSAVLDELRTGDVTMSTVNFQNGGTVNSTSGNLILGGNTSEGGTYALGGSTPGTGGTVSIVTDTRTGSSTQVTGFGTVQTNGGNWFFGNMGPGNISAGSRLKANSGTITINDTGVGGTSTVDTIEVHAGGTITSTSGVGMSLLTNNLIWDGGTISATGTATLATQTNPAALSGSNTMTLGRSWTANSGINYTSTSNLNILAGKTLTNAVGSTMDIASSVVLGGSGTLANNGTLIRSTAGPATIGTIFDNTGTVNINAGTLFVGNGTETGNYNVAAGAQLGRFGGTRTFTAGGISGAGDVAFSGAAQVTTFAPGVTYAPTGQTFMSFGTTTYNNTPAFATYTQSGGVTNLNAGATATSFSLNAPGGTLNLGGGTLTTGAFTLNAGTVAGTGAIASTGALIWGGGTFDNTNIPLSVTGATTVNIGAAPVTLNNAGNDFTGTVTVTNSGAFNVDISDINTLKLGVTTVGNNLNVTAPAGITLSKNVTSGGSQTYNNPVTLSASITTTGVGTTFVSTINGAKSLTVNDVAVTTFGGIVGAITPLTSLTTNALGTTVINGGAISTTGAQTYNDSVTIGNNTVLSGAGVTFANTVNGAKTLLVNDSGATVFGALVGGTTPLASLTTDAAGTSSSVGAIASGAITFNDNTTLSSFYGGSSFFAGGTTTLAGGTTVSPAGGGAATFNGAVNGAQSLTVNTTGATTFSSAVGGITPLTFLLTDAGGTSSSVGVTTTALTTFNDNTTLNGTYNNAGFTAGGTATLAGTVTTINGGGGNVTFSGFIDGTLAGAQSLDVNSTGASHFLSGIGGGKALASLNTDAGGTSKSFGATTTGVTRFLENTTLSGTYSNAGLTAGGTTTLAGTATTVNAGAGAIIFTSTVDGTAAGIQSLTSNSNGATTFGGVVGGTTALSTLTTNAGGTLTLTGVSTTGLQTYGETTAVSLAGAFNTNGTPFVINAPTTLLGDTTVNSGAGNVTFNNFIDATAAGAQSLTVNSSGATNFVAGIGGGKALANLTTDAGGTSSSVGATTTGTTTFNDNTTLNGTYANAGFIAGGNVTLAGATTTVNAGAGNITFTGFIDGTAAGVQSLVANSSGATNFNSGVGGGKALFSLTTDAAGNSTSAGITTTGATIINDTTTLSGTYSNSGFTAGGAATLAGATTINAGGSAIAFAGTVNGANPLTANSTGATTFSGIVGGATPLASLTTNAGGTSSSVGVTTTGATTFNDNATLNGTYNNTGFTAGGTTTLAGTVTTINAGAGNISFNSFIDGTAAGVQTLTANSSGATNFLAGIGGGKALLGLNTDAGGTTAIAAGAVNTTGAITLNDVVNGANVTFNAGAGAITATNPANDFSGVTTLTGSTIQVVDFNALTAVLNATGASSLTAGGNLVVSGVTVGLTTTTVGTGTTNFGITTVAGNLASTSAGAVTQSGALIVGGTTNINAGANPITLTNAGNDFTGAATFTGGIVQVTDSNALSAILAASGASTLSAGGNLSIAGSTAALTTTSGGAVSQTGALIVTGNTNINAGANAITLNNTGNDFQGPLSLTNSGANNIAITDANALILGAWNIGTGTLDVTTNGAITQSGTITQAAGAGPATIDAGSGTITLNASNNDFTGPLRLNGGVTQITDKNALTLSTLNTGALTVTSTGALNLGQGAVGGALTAKSNNNAITQSGALTVAGTSDINAGSNTITLNNASNDFTGALSASGGTVQITDMNTLLLGSLNATTLTLASVNTNLQGTLSTLSNFNLPSGIFTINPGGALTTGAASIAAGATLATGGSFTATGPITVGGILQGSPTGPITATGQTVTVTSGGLLNLNGGSITATTLANQGLLKGIGTINANVNNDGTMSPGASPGLMNIAGNFVQGPTGLLNIEIGGVIPGTGFDKVAVTGNATLNGVLAIAQFGNFVPASTDGFRFLTTGGTINGTFSTILVPAAFAGMSFSYQSQFTDALASAQISSAPQSSTNMLIAATQPIVIYEEKEAFTEEQKKAILDQTCK